ncbi:histone H3.v1-like [Triticum urartu]|uniref:histone H3.v1-like n=1 Tax=Triticum urartu TaxID=4572 RepID=UPI0020431A4D|nr:histone H3.v1-like [Triticum urartu]
MPSYTEAPSESEEEEYVPDGEEEEAEEEGEEEEAEEEGEEEAEEGGGEVDPALWGDLPPGSSQGWLRGNAGLPTPPSIEEHKWLIEPVGTENWILHGKGRKPNGLITVLLKEFWPGLLCPRPDRDPQ